MQVASSGCDHLVYPAKCSNGLEMPCQVGGQSADMPWQVGFPNPSQVHFYPLLDLTDKACEVEHYSTLLVASSGCAHLMCPAQCSNAVDMCHQVGNWHLTSLVKWIPQPVASGFPIFLHFTDLACEMEYCSTFQGASSGCHTLMRPLYC